MNADELMQAVVNGDPTVMNDYVPHLGSLPPQATIAPNGSHVIPFTVGFFPGFKASAHMVTLMKPEMADNGNPVHDLCFGPLIEDAAGDTSKPAFIHAVGAVLIPRALRQQVRSHIINSIRPLLATAYPQTITMHTAEANLPAKAMLKYDDIVAELRRRRFSESSWTEDDGRTYWDFERD